VAGVAVVSAPTASNHEFGADLVSEADARLDGAHVGVGGIARLPADARKQHAAFHGGKAREFCTVDHLIDRIDQIEIEAAIHTVVALIGGDIEIPAQAEVDREALRYSPVILYPWRIVTIQIGREKVEVGTAAAECSQQERSYRVAAQAVGAGVVSLS